LPILTELLGELPLLFYLLGMKFYSYVWDPRLILSQILTLQCLFYLCLGLLLFVLDSISGHSLTLEQIFSSDSINTHHASGWITIAATLINALFGAVFLVYVVERAKKCLDFTGTAYLIHTVSCIAFNGRIPNTWAWWMTNCLALIIMSILGEYLCQRRELQEIPLSNPSSRTSASLVTV